MKRCVQAILLAALVSGVYAPVMAQSSEAQTAAPTAIGGGEGLAVGGIAVDVAGRSASDARFNGWRAAQREAWPLLWARMSGMPPKTAPSMSDSALDGMVSAIEIEQEQMSGTRYVARLAVIFDRVRTARALGRFAALTTSPPYLVLPVLQDAATRQAYEADSPWLAAWGRLRSGETAVDYIRIRPTPGDTILLNSWQAGRQHLPLWRTVIDRYQVADVMIPELVLERTYAGGPIYGVLTARFGPSGKVLGRVRLTNTAGNLEALMDTAVRQADILYNAALRAGNLLPDPAFAFEDVPVTELEDTGPMIGGWSTAGGMQVRVATPDDAALQALQQQIAATPGVSGITLRSMALGGESTLEITSGVSAEMLRYNLDQRGLRLDNGVLRPRAAGEAPLPQPAAPAPVPADDASEVLGGGD